jgi:GT2 family glycosyltransferase
MLSIIIPTANRPDLLRNCLRSVQANAPADVEILVVADGYPVDACSAIEVDFPTVRLVHLPRRRGFCVAANAGIEAAHGEFIELLNDDTEVQPGWAEAALTAFSEPGIAAVAPLVLRWPDGQLIDSAGDEYHRSGIARKRGHGQLLSAEFLAPSEVFGASASGAFYRRDVLLEVGSFPEHFGAYFDDVDLSFRLRRAGFRVWYEPRSRILHHGSGSHDAADRRLLEQQSRNEERLFWRHVEREQLWKTLPEHAAVLAGKALKRWNRGEFLPFLAGRLQAFTELPSILRARWSSDWRKKPR